MSKLGDSFRYFRPFKALVLGDFMLDTYTTGRVKRISPEAPVPVLEVFKEESRPGGAGNVVLNLLALGGSVITVGRIGRDAEGVLLRKHLSGADTTALLEEISYSTPVKTRLIADSQQLIRIDREELTPVNAALEDEVLKLLETLIPSVDVVAVSDYGKGFLSSRILQAALRLAKKAKVPSIVDPKGSDFSKYQGATVLKPNLMEAYTAAKLPPTASLEEVAQKLQPLADILLITRSEAGISIFTEGHRKDFPVRSKEVKDVTGAGDTVLAMISLGLANGLSVEQTADLANVAAGLAIEKVGCVQITLSELAERLLEIDANTKVFDDTYALQQVLKGKQYGLLVLEKNQMMTRELFRAVRRLAADNRLVIYAQGFSPDDELIYLLSSLPEICSILLQTESLKSLCDAILPQAVYFLDQFSQVQRRTDHEVLSSLLKKTNVKILG